MKIRYRGKWQDPILADMDRKTFPGDDPVAMADSFWWTVHDDHGDPVGFAGLSTSRDVNGAMITMQITRTGLLPTARGRGVQKQLIRVLLRRARKLGANRVTTSTHYGNLPSMRNLITCGFKPYHQQEGFLWWQRFL